MTLFDERERAFEAKYRLDQDTAFRITMRRDKLLGLWAAEEMGLSGDEAKAYARSLVEAEVERQDVVHKVLADLTANGQAMDEAELRRQLYALHERAREQIFAEFDVR